jgi:hypothetical protein
MTTGETAPDAASAPARRRGAREKPGRDRALGAPGLPRPSLQSKGWRFTLVGAAVVLLLGWLVWYAATPEELPTSDRTVSASGVVDVPLFVGMFTAGDEFDRTLRVSGVKVHTSANERISVTPLLCRRGTVGVTTDPDQFCSEMVNPEGERFVAGDSIVLKVESAKPALAIIDRIRIAYREDIRWDTQPAGNHQAIISIAGRPETEAGAESE